MDYLNYTCFVVICEQGWVWGRWCYWCVVLYGWWKPG